MTMCYFPYTLSLTLLVSPHRAGLTVDEARRLIEGFSTEDMESKDLRIDYALTEIAETLIDPGLSLPDPELGTPIATVQVHDNGHGQGIPELQQELLRRWETAYAQATLHEPL